MHHDPCAGLLIYLSPVCTSPSPRNHRDREQLRSEVLSVRSINEETADETSKILNELSACQQRCAKLAAELSCKEQMAALLHLQVGDLVAAAAASTAANGTSERSSPARPASTAATPAGVKRRSGPATAAIGPAAIPDVWLGSPAAAREVRWHHDP